jgi:AraC-like DNA-binding protein
MLLVEHSGQTTCQMRTTLPGAGSDIHAGRASEIHKAGRFVFVSRGGVWVRVGRRAFCVSKNWGVWLPPGVICFEYPVMASDLLQLVTSGLQSERLSPNVTVSRCAESVCAAFAQLQNREERVAVDSSVDMYIAQTVASANDIPDALVVRMPSYGSRLTDVCESVLQNPNKVGQIDKAATALSVTVRTLGRLFQEELGTSAAKWRRNVQIATACCALDNGVPVSEIAQRLGYGHGAFSTLFRSRLGYSPREQILSQARFRS